MRRALALAVGVAIPASAFANYGVTIAFTVFDTFAWIPYVSFTLLFEAYAIHRLFDVPFRKGLFVSLYANLLTAMLGFFALCLGLAAIGDMNNPQPFLWALDGLPPANEDVIK